MRRDNVEMILIDGYHVGKMEVWIVARNTRCSGKTFKVEVARKKPLALQ